MNRVQDAKGSNLGKPKALLSQGQFLNVAWKAAHWFRGGRLASIDYDKAMLYFKVASHSRKGLFHTVKISLESIADQLYYNKVAERVYNPDPKKKNFSSLGDKQMLSHVKPITKQNLTKKLEQGHMKVYCSCVAKGTRIKIRRGYKRIEEIEVGDEVLTKDGTWAKVERLIHKGVKPIKLIDIVGSIDSLGLTEDHKMFMSTYRDYCACGCSSKLRDVSSTHAKLQAYSMYEKRKFLPRHGNRKESDGFERFKMVPVSEYKPGYLATSPIVKSSLCYDFNRARMLGYYLAEGNVIFRKNKVIGNTVRITLNQNEEETIATDIVNYFTSIGTHTKVKRLFYKEQKWLTVTIYDRLFRDECLLYCGRKSEQKNLHSDIFLWDLKSKEHFLLGHLLGDGVCYGVEKGFAWLTSSRDLAEDLQILLASIYANGKVSYHNHSKDGKGEDTTLPTYKVCVPFYQFDFVCKDNIHLFREKDKLNVLVPRKTKGLKSQKSITEKQVLRTIRGITDGEPADVYDIVLSDPSHSFQAAGVSVSNCEQFLFFGFKYIAWHKGYGLEKESRAPRVRNPKREGAVCIHIFYILAYVFPQILPQVERLLIKEGLLDYLKEPVKNNDKDDKLKK